ncbi:MULTISPECIES: DUF3152 domain-containing protein [Saccharothrix]|uniref:DUF3152 domain-containing protein n=1 Tax=Saccharothrix TaxID=2071 RepID=UPI00093C7507|nr:DUF3152 domain-containing protein [Saccharothrix sp. CB00851]OKI18522.1 hypothetical protein A6A25_39905 [Saccharothrix sp. CB00851]
MNVRVVLVACAVTALVLTYVRFAAERPAARSAQPVQSAVIATHRAMTTAVRTTTTVQTTTTKRTYASSADLPDGGPIPTDGHGTFHAVPGTSPVVGTGAVRTYAVEVEDGVAADERAFGAFVQETLSDPRGWTARGDVAFRRVTGPAAIRVRLTSQNTARAVCGYEIPVDVSCRNGGVVHLSAARWVRGAVAFDGDLTAYRRYMVNHEVGHALGEGHRPCPAHGGPAPVMMQQTFSTSNDEVAAITAGVPQGVVVPVDGKVCRPNGWPFP